MRRYAPNDLRAPWNDWSPAQIPQRRPDSPYFDADRVEWSVEPDLFDYAELRGTVAGVDRSVRGVTEPILTEDIVDEAGWIGLQARALGKLHAAFACSEEEVREVGM